MNLAGASSIIWYKKHCVAHHNHTNVLGHDEDTDTGDLIRLHPGSESFKYQKYQHLYSWPLYALHTIRWMLFDDILDYRSNKWNLNKKEMKSLLVEIIYSKAWHISIFMLVPYLVSGSLLITAIFYLLHFSLIGLSVATTFNLAHVTRVQDFYLDKDEKPKDWAVHQIKTTADFAGQSAILTWMVGGLNLQTIHHIFPNISHVHYRKIQKIVLEFCKERGVEYNNYPTVWSALKDHYKHLKELGNPV
jgi:linoleoyl-CoA desaturase